MPAPRCTKDPCSVHPDIKISVIQRPDQNIRKRSPVTRHLTPVSSRKREGAPLPVIGRSPPAHLQGLSHLRPDTRVPVKQHLPQHSGSVPAPDAPERPDCRDLHVVVGIHQEGDEMRRRTLIPDPPERPDHLEPHGIVGVGEERDERFRCPGVADRTERLHSLPPDIRVRVGQRPDEGIDCTRVAQLPKAARRHPSCILILALKRRYQATEIPLRNEPANIGGDETKRHQSPPPAKNPAGRGPQSFPVDDTLSRPKMVFEGLSQQRRFDGFGDDPDNLILVGGELFLGQSPGRADHHRDLQGSGDLSPFIQEP